MYDVIVTTLVLIFVIVSIISHKLPTIAVGLLIPLILSITGVIDPSTAFQGLGSTTIFLIIGALVIGDACFRTGLTDYIGSHVIRYARKFHNEPIKLLVIGLLAAGMSTFLSSFGVQVAFLSLIVLMSQTLRISKTRALLLLGYASSVGGMWSIIGTTLMVMSKSTYEGLVPGGTIGMFEFTRVSLPIGLAVILCYCFITSRFLPDRCGQSLTQAEETDSDKPVSLPSCRRDRIVVAVTFFAFIVLVALDGHTPIPANMVTVLVLLVFGAFRISTVSDMVGCISWDMIFFIVGITVLSNAMAASGLSDLVGSLLITLVGDSANPYVIIAVISVVSSVLTQLMSNSGAFGVVLPFLPVLASSLGVELKPLIAAAAISCTCGFCLPLAAPSFLMLAEEGNIRATDFIRQGIPLAILSVVLTVILIPLAFPLY